MGYHTNNCDADETKHFRAMVDVLRGIPFEMSWRAIADGMDAARFFSGSDIGNPGGFIKDAYDRKPVKRVYGALWKLYEDQLRSIGWPHESNGRLIDEKLRRGVRIATTYERIARGQAPPVQQVFDTPARVPEEKQSTKPASLRKAEVAAEAAYKQAEKEKVKMASPKGLDPSVYRERVIEHIKNNGKLNYKDRHRITGDKKLIAKAIHELVEAGVLTTEGQWPPKRGKSRTIVKRVKSMVDVAQDVVPGGGSGVGPTTEPEEAETPTVAAPPPKGKKVQLETEGQTFDDPISAARSLIRDAAEALEMASNSPPQSVPPFMREHWRTELGTMRDDILNVLTRLED